MTSRWRSRREPRSSGCQRPFSGAGFTGEAGLSAHRRRADIPTEASPMNVSPLDLRQQRFRTKFRGFDTVEVTSFLTAVAEDYEQALRETDRLRQDLARMDGLLNEHRENEQTLRSTLLTAQRLSDDIQANAGKEAERIVHDAEGRSNLLL